MGNRFRNSTMHFENMWHVMAILHPGKLLMGKKTAIFYLLLIGR
jgi:hypothetical protein